MQFEQKELCYFIDAIKLDCSVQNSINNSSSALGESAQ